VSAAPACLLPPLACWSTRCGLLCCVLSLFSLSNLDSCASPTRTHLSGCTEHVWLQYYTQRPWHRENSLRAGQHLHQGGTTRGDEGRGRGALTAGNVLQAWRGGQGGEGRGVFGPRETAIPRKAVGRAVNFDCDCGCGYWLWLWWYQNPRLSLELRLNLSLSRPAACFIATARAAAAAAPAARTAAPAPPAAPLAAPPAAAPPVVALGQASAAGQARRYSPHIQTASHCHRA
jgi:hypothetical protein